MVFISEGSATNSTNNHDFNPKAGNIFRHGKCRLHTRDMQTCKYNQVDKQTNEMINCNVSFDFRS